MSTPRQVNSFAAPDMQPSKPHAMEINGIRGVWLPLDFVTTERGNTLLEAPDDLRPNLVAWLELTETIRLELTLIARNSPALHLGIHVKGQVELAQHIQTELSGWLVHRCNVEGVKTTQEDGHVLIADELQD